jgi:hypothetical protein
MTESATANAVPASAASVGSIEAWLDRPRNWIACALGVLALQAVLVLTHQPWLDEWQALQISLQSPTLSALLENLRYEGHPPVWYLLLRGVGSVIPPGWVLPAVQLPIALALEALILFRLPLGRIERLLLACNPYVLIDYGAISRSLGLGVLLLMAALLFRRRRSAWLPIAVLPMMDFLFGVLSIAIVALSWREKRLWVPGVALWLACGLAAAWSVRPAPDMIPALWLEGPVHDGLVEMTRFGALLVPLAIADGHLIWNQTPPAIPALIGGILFIGMGLWLLRRDRLLQATFAGFVALILLFSVFVYPLAIRHASLAAVLLVLLVALLHGRQREDLRVFTAWLALGACCGIAMAVANFLRPFDTAPEAAAFILDHHLEGKHWVSFPDSRAQGVSALTGVEFERLERDCTQSFIRWNYRSRVNSPADLHQELQRIANRSGSFYLLTDFDLRGVSLSDRGTLRTLLFVPAGVDGQAFYLYEVRPDLPTKPEHLPQCPPQRLPLRIMG